MSLKNLSMIRVLHPHDHQTIAEAMRKIGVDPYGIQIMVPKAKMLLVEVGPLPSFVANILKQEMLSLGGDVALAKGALTGRVKKTHCLLMGNMSQFIRLQGKLTLQPFGLKDLALELKKALDNYNHGELILELGSHKIDCRKRFLLMGILNITPDSFSGDGLYGRSLNEIQKKAEWLVKDGADCIDIGGESSRPNSKPISSKEEIKRVLPVIKILARKVKVPISIDTYKPEVAKAALDYGVCLVNDITGLRNPRMLPLVAKYKASVVIMHMQGNPKTMQLNPHYQDVCAEILKFLTQRIKVALQAGILKNRIAIDPGIGFGKTLEHNLIILKNLRQFHSLGRPVLVGPSRKSFIGKILNLPPSERIFGTVSSCVIACQNGAHILRVHDVKEVKQALRVLQAIRNS